MASNTKQFFAISIINLLLLWTMLHNGLAVNKIHPEFEKTLLRKLGLTQKPVINPRLKIPSATIRQYELMKNGNPLSVSFSLPGLNKISTNVARTYFINGSFPIHTKSKTYHFQFHINNLPKHERVVGAELRIAMSKNINRNEFVRILVYDIVKPASKNMANPTIRFIDSKLLPLSNSSNQQVISFDVTPSILRVLESNFNENYGIQMQCITQLSSQTSLTDVFDFGSHEKPLLMIYSEDGTMADEDPEATAAAAAAEKEDTATVPTAPAVAKVAAEMRGKRSNKTAATRLCQRYPMYVNLKEIGYGDFVHKPEGFEAYHCRGECVVPSPAHLSSSSHALVQTMVHHLKPSMGVPPACCVPIRLSAQSLLYSEGDNGNLVVRNFRAMLADECGCR